MSVVLTVTAVVLCGGVCIVLVVLGRRSRKAALMSIETVPDTGLHLLRTDVCDARGCGARAYVVTVFASRSEMTWCAHHFSHLEAALRETAVSVIDYRDELETA